MQRRRYLAGAAGAVGLLAGCSALRSPGDTPDSTTGDGATGDDSATITTDETVVRVETVATDLEIPWGVAFHEGDAYLTERPGRIVRVRDGTVEPVATFEDTAAVGEGGLLGLALAPDGEHAYTYQTYESSEGLRNRIRRHSFPAFAATETVFDGIPGGRIHDGGRIAISPGGALFATAGDAADRADAQDTGALNGKVLRLTLDGASDPDNPFENAVFSYGHRNPQGLAWHPETGELYCSEHGPDTDDEMNVLRAGGNFGWPEVMGHSENEAFVDPIATWTPTIAPGSAAFYDGPLDPWRGNLFVPTLSGTHLRRLGIDAEARDVTGQERLFDGRFGRLRTAAAGPDGHLYLTTSNRDGRGSPASPDDRLLRVVPA